MSRLCEVYDKMPKMLLIMLTILLPISYSSVNSFEFEKIPSNRNLSSSTFGTYCSSNSNPVSSTGYGSSNYDSASTRSGTYSSSKSNSSPSHFSITDYSFLISRSSSTTIQGESASRSPSSRPVEYFDHSSSTSTSIESPCSPSVCEPNRCGSSSSSSFVSPCQTSPSSPSQTSPSSPSYTTSSSSSSSSSSRSSHEPTCSCGSIRKPRSCLELKQRGYNTSGNYSIAPCDQRPCDEVEVYCDMDTDGGGWTVFQNRGKDTLLNFNRNFQSYRNGFGNASTDFWLGNEYIHCLTSQTYTELMVVMKDWCNKVLKENYRCFYVSDRNSRFELRLKNVTENSITDSLMPHSNAKFSTHDRDTGNMRASQLGSGWWHTAPHSNLNGVYRTQDDSSYCCRQRKSQMMNQTMQSCKTDGIFWRKWHGITYSLKTTTMMLRGRDPQDNRANMECNEIDTGFCQAKSLISEATHMI